MESLQAKAQTGSYIGMPKPMKADAGVRRDRRARSGMRGFVRAIFGAILRNPTPNSQILQSASISVGGRPGNEQAFLRARGEPFFILTFSSEAEPNPLIPHL